MDPQYYYDSDDSLSEQLSPEYPEELVFPEDDIELLNRKLWFEDNDSPTGSVRSGKSNRESKKYHHMNTLKQRKQSVRSWHIIMRRYDNIIRINLRRGLHKDINSTSVMLTPVIVQ